MPKCHRQSGPEHAGDWLCALHQAGNETQVGGNCPCLALFVAFICCPCLGPLEKETIQLTVTKYQVPSVKVRLDLSE